MKKIFYLLGVLVFVLSTLFISCKKEMNSKLPESPKLSTQNQKILDLIHHFKTTMNSNLKDEETLSIDSTVWFIESTLNETYARADSLKTILYKDSAFVHIPVNQDQSINRSGVDSAYNEFVHDLGIFYHSITGDPGVLFADISLVGAISSTATLKMIMMVGTPGTIQSIWFGAFDNWYWGLGKGKCDDTHVGKDATTELTRHANWSIPFPGPGVFYVNIYTTNPIYPWDVPLPTGNSNPFGYWNDYLFGDGSDFIPEFNECLTHDAMNYYLSSLFTIADNYKPQALSVTNYYCDFDFTQGVGYWTHIHYSVITYGLGVTDTEPPAEPPIE